VGGDPSKWRYDYVTNISIHAARVGGDCKTA